MRRVLVIVPFAFDEEGLANRRQQLREDRIAPDMEFEYRGVVCGPALFDSYHDLSLVDLAMFEVGMNAEEEGFDAVCIDTMSDSGMNALRSVLSIPVVSPGLASFHTALMLGHKFSVVTQWDGWLHLYRKLLREYGLEHLCASCRSINVSPDVKNLLAGKESDVFPALERTALQCVEEDGADVICLGSTTMHQSHEYLAGRLPVPIINPGQLTYKLVDLFLTLGLAQSRHAYPSPAVPMKERIGAMLEAGAGVAV